jgi:3-deoxy-D-manno-octulosonic-acid transferase
MSGVRSSLARAGYSTLLAALAPLFTLRWWLRGRVEPNYRVRITERFGHYPGVASNGWLWVHAVSLGETRAASALIDALRAQHPGMRLLLTHGTATGREAGQALLHSGDQQTWLPYDTPGAVDRFFSHFRPATGVLMETEVWPNLLLAARARGVPMVLANARLSAKSLNKGRRFAALLGPAIRSLSLVLAQTQDDAARLREAGASAVQVCGNLKFDLTPDARQLAQGAAWRELLNREVVLAAITREGEEGPLLAAWTRHGASGALLLIVPRHPQRFDEIAAMVQDAGLTLARRSDWSETPTPQALHAQVWLGDSMREMALYYATAHVALLGGSFAPLGGHNLIEAAACGCPLVMGPSTFNFSQAADLSLAAGASVRVSNIEAGVVEAVALLREPARLALLSTNAVRFAVQHRGAAERMARYIAPFMDEGGQTSASATH